MVMLPGMQNDFHGLTEDGFTGHNDIDNKVCYCYFHLLMFP